MSVLRNSMAIVSGPTPPGTGVIREATWATLAKCDVAAEPAVVAFVNAHVDHDSARLHPIGGDLFGPSHRDDQADRPAARRTRRRGWRCGKRSRSRRPPALSGARETPSVCPRSAIGPERPHGPLASRTPLWIKSSRMPSGVQGTNRGEPAASRPKLKG